MVYFSGKTKGFSHYFAIVALFSCAAMAAGPAPEHKLKQTQEQLKASEERYRKMQAEQSEAEKELEEIQERVLALAKDARGREDALMRLENEQRKLEKGIAEIHQEMKRGRKEISALLSALIRLANVPSEAVIAMPGKLRDNMEAAGVLHTMTEKLRVATQDLTARLDKLGKSKDELEVKRYQIAGEQKSVADSQAALEKELEQRRQVLAKLNLQGNNEKLKIVALVKQSRDLQSLLAKLEADRIAQEKIRLAKKPETAVIPTMQAKTGAQWKPLPKNLPEQKIPARSNQFQSFSAAKGRLNYPVAGAVMERFGQSLGQNRTSKGITLASRVGNSVVAPYSGEVVFTGPFLDYGNMVILRYDNGYHLLVAGLSDINCSNGQTVSSGEPLGRVGKNRNGKLYIELRYQGKPVNPSPWFG